MLKHRGLFEGDLEVVNPLSEPVQQVVTRSGIRRSKFGSNHGMAYRVIIRCYKGGPLDFSASGVGR